MPYFDDYSIEAKFDGVNWTDITPDVIDEIVGSYGLSGDGLDERIAQSGSLKFTLNNGATNSGGLVGYYSPGHANCRSGFGVGLLVRIKFVLDGATVIKWQGRVETGGIKVQTGVYSAKRVDVIAQDWFYQTENYEIRAPVYAQDKRIDQVVPLVLDQMSVQPAGVPKYYDGEYLFESIFDTVREKTTATSELAKLVNSEMGYIYLTRFGLTVEGRYTRYNEKSDLAYIPVLESLSGLLLKEDASYLLLETGDNIILDQVELPDLSDAQMEMDVEYGGSLCNRIRITAYPREVGAVATDILFSLQAPIKLGANSTIKIPFFVTNPISIIIPIWLKMFNV